MRGIWGLSDLVDFLQPQASALLFFPLSLFLFISLISSLSRTARRALFPLSQLEQQTKVTVTLIDITLPSTKVDH